VTVEPVTVETPRPVRRRLLTQWWRDLTFLHWPADPEVVANLLPPGTRPDIFGGVTYVGLVPFQMDEVGLLGTSGVPYFGTFWETNVRLYSVDGEGRRGVVFRSLDAAGLVPVAVARAGLSLPYVWSSMRMTKRGDVLAYSCRRRLDQRAVTSRVAVKVGPRIAEPTELEHFLTARWGLHVFSYGRTLYLPNEHPQWPLHQAELLSLDDQLIDAAGLPQPTDPPISVLYSAGVRVRFGPPQIVR
jgi:uncharacterized protein YqjF (DUF2071 family)